MSGRTKTRLPKKTHPVGLLVQEDRPWEDTSDKPFIMQRVLCFYGRAHEVGSSHAVVHEVAQPSGNLGPGHPVDPIEFAKSVHLFKRGELIEPLILREARVLAENRDAILWWRPPTVTPMWFKTAEPVPELTALNGKPVPHPGLIFRAEKQKGASLFCWAVLGSERPTATTPLHYAPYMNMYSSAAVCLGSARDSSLAEAKKTGPDDWERLFFDSNFSHTTPPLRYGKAAPTPIADPAAEAHATGEDAVAKRKASLVSYAAWVSHLAGAKPEDLPGIFAGGLVPTGKTVATLVKAQE